MVADPEATRWQTKTTILVRPTSSCCVELTVLGLDGLPLLPMRAERQDEELTALQAIFGDDCDVHFQQRTVQVRGSLAAARDLWPRPDRLDGPCRRCSCLLRASRAAHRAASGCRHNTQRLPSFRDLIRPRYVLNIFHRFYFKIMFIPGTLGYYCVHGCKDAAILCSGQSGACRRGCVVRVGGVA